VGGAAPAIVVALTGTFILVYYSKALGVPAWLVGAVLAAALVLDAFWDPFVGYISDNFRSHWGRRHPFMYGAIAPVTLLCYAVWNPPKSLGPGGLALYLFATIVPLRLFLALFDVPSTALTAELTSDYDERTRLSMYRLSFSWILITGFSATLYGYWLRNTPSYPDGLVNPGGYQAMGLTAAIVVFATMLICAIGLHPLIPKLRKPGAKQRSSPWDLFLSLRNTFSERTLAPLIGASALISTGFQVYGALFSYLFGYFWRLTPAELSGTMLAWLLGACGGFLAPPLLGRVREKRVLALIAISGISLSVGLPVLLGLVGFFPASGSAARYLLLCFFLFFDMLTFLVTLASLNSMLADGAEHRELMRGRREEGTIFAAQTLIVKLSGALGVGISGLLLELIEFPTGSVLVPAGTVRSLAVVWILGQVSFYALAILSLLSYRQTRAGHARNLEALRRSARQ